MKCEICGTEFAHIGKQKYCSESCLSTSRHRKHARKRQNVKNQENMEKFRRFLRK